MTATARRLSKALALAALLATPLAALDVASADGMYGKLLVRYVTPAGVRYASWRAIGDDFKELSQVVTAYRAADTKSLPAADRQAFMINYHNARVLEAILQGNPSRSIRDLSKALKPNEIFSRNLMVFEGRPISFDGIERKLLDDYKDPRVLFALHRAAKTSPPLRTEPYDSARLDAQLDDAASSYLALPGVLEVKTAGGKTTIVAPHLFETQAGAFKAGGGALAFLAGHGRAPVSEAIKAGGARVKLEFRPDDWSLNAVH